MKKLFAVLSLLLVLNTPLAFGEGDGETPAYAGEVYVEIIFDGSGSMAAWLYTQKKIDIAKDALETTLGAVEDSAFIGLRAYGLEKDNCQSSELLVDFALGNKDEIVGAVAELQPTGDTPLAYSVRKAVEDLKDKNGIKKIIVIGDGQETCEGDIPQAGLDVKNANIDLDALYLGGSDLEAGSLQGLAEASGGEFYKSHVPDRFMQALSQALSDIPFGDFDFPSVGGSAPVTVTEEVIEEQTLENFEENCQLPAKIGDQVLYQEYELESVEGAGAASTGSALGLEVVLDVSGSMGAKVEGSPKIDIARGALETALAEVGEGTDLAFRVYGHRFSRAEQAQSCTDTELLLPFSADAGTSAQVAKLRTLAAKLTPKGWTPIGFSLKEAAKDLTEFDTKVILLLSDGEETCGGDPVGVMEELKAQGIEITVHTIGFDVDATTAKQLKAISEASGGTYVDAGSIDELREGLSYVVEEATKESKGCPTLFQNPVHGGESFDTAVELGEGAYTFDTFLEKGQKYFFKVPVKSGQLVRLYGLAARPQISGNRKDGFFEKYDGLKSAFDIVPYDNDRVPVKNKNFRPLTVEAAKESRIAVLEDGYMYLEIGYDFSPVHKDNIFSVQIDDYFDGGSEADVNETLPAQFGETSDMVGGLGLEDKKDVYIVPKTAKAVSSLQIMFDEPEYKATVDVYDEKGKLVDRLTALSSFALTTPLKPGYKVVLEDRYITGDFKYSGYKFDFSGAAGSVVGGGVDFLDDTDDPDGNETSTFLAFGTSSRFWIYIVSTAGILLLAGLVWKLRKEKSDAS